MGAPIRFELGGGESAYSRATEIGCGEIATFLDRARAKAAVAYFNREHANGRVAQGHCSKGAACDRYRINDLAMFRADRNRRDVILCPEHRAQVFGEAP